MGRVLVVQTPPDASWSNDANDGVLSGGVSSTDRDSHGGAEDIEGEHGLELDNLTGSVCGRSCGSAGSRGVGESGTLSAYM